MGIAKAPSDVQIEKLEFWMEAYGTILMRMCYAYLKDASLAEDAVQDTFVKACMHMDRLGASDVRAEKAWLMRIAINTCKDYRRSAWFKHVDRTISAEDFLATSEYALMPHERKLLAEVMDLPIRLREVVLLHFYQDLTINEVCSVLSLPKSTVYARLKKAKERLRSLLERRIGDE